MLFFRLKDQLAAKIRNISYFGKKQYSETGKVVAEETIQDAQEPFSVKWYNHSFAEIPIREEK